MKMIFAFKFILRLKQLYDGGPRLLKYRKPTLCVAGPSQESCEALPREDG